jgi:hypothetical protein
MPGENKLGFVGEWAANRKQEKEQAELRELGAAGVERKRKNNPFNSAPMEAAKTAVSACVRVVNFSARAVDDLFPDSWKK